MENIDFIRTLKLLPGIILGLTVHEFCHAYIAHLCGDSTSRDQGRITLNPLKHIDLLGFIMLMVAGFGWAKPVQFNEQNLRNPSRDVMKIAVAGPLSNALIAMLLSVIFTISVSIVPIYSSNTSRLVYEILHYAIYINWGLFIFNLIPLPPLDGSHLLLNQFRKFPGVYSALYRYGSIILLILIVASVITKIDFLPILPIMKFLGEGFLALVGFRG